MQATYHIGSMQDISKNEYNMHRGKSLSFEVILSQAAANYSIADERNIYIEFVRKAISILIRRMCIQAFYDGVYTVAFNIYNFAQDDSDRSHLQLITHVCHW